MLVCNIIVFAVVIVIVCITDLSVLSTDESVDRLLYFEEQDEKPGSKEEAAASSEVTAASDNEAKDVQKAVSDLEDIIEAAECSDFAVNEKTTPVSQNSCSDGLGDGFANNPANQKGQTAEYRKDSHELHEDQRIVIPEELLGADSNTKCPARHISVRHLQPDTENNLDSGLGMSADFDSELGMSADFADDFMDPSDIIREIHDGGMPS
jgi:hypothetical protein